MQSYIGAKIIAAEPQTKDGVSGYKVVYPDGYESWSPADVFERSYRPVTRADMELMQQYGANIE